MPFYMLLPYWLKVFKNSKSVMYVKVHLETKYRWTLLYARDRNFKNMLAYNEFAYKKTYDHCKLEDRFQKKKTFFNRIYANLQIKRPHIMRAACM